MKIKNVVLKFKDLYNGRIVYFSEPGKPVVKAKVLYKKRGVFRYKTYHAYNHDVPLEKLYIGHPFKALSADELKAKLGESTAKNIVVGSENEHIVPTRGVIVDFLTTFSNTDFYVQDIFFDPEETNMRCFAKYKQAEHWSKRPELEELETLYNPVE